MMKKFGKHLKRKSKTLKITKCILSMKKIILSLIIILFAFSTNSIAQSRFKSDYQKKVSRNFQKRKGRNVKFKHQGYLYDKNVKKETRRAIIRNYNQMFKRND